MKPLRKHIKSVALFTLILILSLACSKDDELSDIEMDIIGSWGMDKVVHIDTGEDISETYQFTYYLIFYNDRKVIFTDSLFWSSGVSGEWAYLGGNNFIFEFAVSGIEENKIYKVSLKLEDEKHLNFINPYNSVDRLYFIKSN